MKSKPRKPIFILIGVALGLIIACVTASIFSLNILENGFATWQFLGNPGKKISQIVSVENDGVFVELENGQLFKSSYWPCQYLGFKCWDEITNPTLIPGPDDYPIEFQIGSECSTLFDMQEPPYPITQCISFYSSVGVEFYHEIHYALLEDGNIWLWENSYGHMSLPIPGDSLLAIIIAIFVAPCIGIMVGLSGGIGLWAILNRKSQTKKQGQI